MVKGFNLNPFICSFIFVGNTLGSAIPHADWENAAPNMIFSIHLCLFCLSLFFNFLLNSPIC